LTLHRTTANSGRTRALWQRHTSEHAQRCQCFSSFHFTSGVSIPHIVLYRAYQKSLTSSSKHLQNFRPDLFFSTFLNLLRAPVLGSALTGTTMCSLPFSRLFCDNQTLARAIPTLVPQSFAKWDFEICLTSTSTTHRDVPIPLRADSSFYSTQRCFVLRAAFVPHAARRHVIIMSFIPIVSPYISPSGYDARESRAENA